MTHSKPRDLARYRCPTCYGGLQQTKPAPRELSEYTLFAKNNLAKLKRENPSTPMKEVMGLVGQQWKMHKAGQTPATGKGRAVRDESPTVARGVDTIVISDSEEESVGDLMGGLKI